VTLSHMTSGPGQTMGPTCRFKKVVVWVCSRVCLANYVRVVLIPILNFNFMLIFENLYLMIEKSKNSKSGLFENLEKRSMQYSHKVLHVCRYFLMSLFKP
jgi:hypothetical protein